MSNKTHSRISNEGLWKITRSYKSTTEEYKKAAKILKRRGQLVLKKTLYREGSK